MTDWGIETERRIDLYRVQELKRLVRPSDSRVDSTSSSSCNIWLGAHRTCSSVDETMWNNDDWMFRECGYVFWDYTSVALNFGSIRRALYVKRPHFKKRDREWRQDDLSRSWTRRNDIRLAGGSGFWPWNGLNFSRIRGWHPGIVCHHSLIMLHSGQDTKLESFSTSMPSHNVLLFYSRHILIIKLYIYPDMKRHLDQYTI